MVAADFFTFYFSLNLLLAVVLLLFAGLNQSRLRLKSFGTREDFVLTQITIFYWSLFMAFVYTLAPATPSTSHTWSDDAADFILLFFCHDLYIYLSHRLLHTKLLFRKIHTHHHKVRTQTPLAAWSVHPLEALIDAFAIILLATLLPVRPEVVVVYSVFIFKMNLLGHFTLGPQASKPIKAVLYAYSNFHHHNIHHEQPKRNFGALSLWDRMLRTHTTVYRKELRSPVP